MKKSLVLLVAAIIIALSSCKKEDTITPNIPSVADTITQIIPSIDTVIADTAVLVECMEASYREYLSSIDSNATISFQIRVNITNLTDKDIYINGKDGMYIETQPDSIRRLRPATTMYIVSRNAVHMGDHVYRISAHTTVHVIYSGVEMVVIPNSFFYRAGLKTKYSFDNNGIFRLSATFRNSCSTEWVNP